MTAMQPAIFENSNLREDSEFQNTPKIFPVRNGMKWDGIRSLQILGLHFHEQTVSNSSLKNKCQQTRKNYSQISANIQYIQ